MIIFSTPVDIPEQTRKDSSIRMLDLSAVIFAQSHDFHWKLSLLNTTEILSILSKTTTFSVLAALAYPTFVSPLKRVFFLNWLPDSEITLCPCNKQKYKDQFKCQTKYVEVSHIISCNLWCIIWTERLYWKTKINVWLSDK